MLQFQSSLLQKILEPQLLFISHLGMQDKLQKIEDTIINLSLKIDTLFQDGIVEPQEIYEIYHFCTIKMKDSYYDHLSLEIKLILFYGNMLRTCKNNQSANEYMQKIMQHLRDWQTKTNN